MFNPDSKMGFMMVYRWIIYRFLINPIEIVILYIYRYLFIYYNKVCFVSLSGLSSNSIYYV